VGDVSLRRIAFRSPAPSQPRTTFDGLPVGYHGDIGFQALVEAAHDEANLRLYLRSGYRSYATQGVTFANWIRDERIRLGLSWEGAVRKVSTYSARPGHSEHQLGTTVDLTFHDEHGVLYGGWDLNTMGNSRALRWVADQAHRFGIVLTYGKDKVNVTRYQWEPWHFRYVGFEAANLMKRCHLSTEEFLSLRYQQENVTWAKDDEPTFTLVRP